MTHFQRQPSVFWKACLVALLAAAVVLGSLVVARRAFGYPEFIEDAVAPAQTSQRDTGAPASVTVAQAILESEWSDEPSGAELAGDPDIAIAYVGEDARLRIEALNTGLETWKREQVVLSNVKQPLNAGTTQPLPADTPPGKTATWELQVRAPDRAGVYKSDWRLKQADQAFGSTLSAYLIVLPEGASELEEKIRAKIEEWRQQAEQEIDDLIDEITALILEEVENFFQGLVDDLRANACGASALVVLGILLLWWRKS